MTESRKKKKSLYQNWLVPGVIGLVFLAGFGFLVKVMLTDVGPRRKEQISTVTLLKPPPPEVKEKPPEPETPKEAPKETILAPDTPQQAQDSPDQSQDDALPGSDLGVDSEGGAGSDAFGLVGKKGGRGLTLGGGGGGGRLSLLAKYGGYLQKIQNEIRLRVKKRLEEDGGIPKGKYLAQVKVVLDSRGAIVDYEIAASSGNPKIDKALKEALNGARISEPPPEGMPHGMTIKISSQG